jgi:hypothetical protein
MRSMCLRIDTRGDRIYMQQGRNKTAENGGFLAPFKDV